MSVQTTAVTDWSRTVNTDDKTTASSDTLRTNLEVVVGTPKKKLPVVNDDDVLNDDFFTERTNRFHSRLNMCVVVLSVVKVSRNAPGHRNAVALAFRCPVET